MARVSNSSGLGEEAVRGRSSCFESDIVEEL